MKISVRHRIGLFFALYIHMYCRDKFNDLAKGLYPDFEPDDLNDDQIQEVINHMEKGDIKVFRIPYANNMHDNIDDFIKELHVRIDQVNIYNKLRDDIHKSE